MNGCPRGRLIQRSLSLSLWRDEPGNAGCHDEALLQPEAPRGPSEAFVDAVPDAERGHESVSGHPSDWNIVLYRRPRVSDSWWPGETTRDAALWCKILIMHQHNENRVLRILWIAMHMHDALVAADFCSAAFAVYHTANLSELIFS